MQRWYEGDYTLDKQLTPSKIAADRYNVVLTFSNGVQFSYEDGQYEATQNGMPIEVDGQYIIETKDEIIKFSFDPTSGKVWWIVQPFKKK